MIYKYTKVIISEKGFNQVIKKQKTLLIPGIFHKEISNFQQAAFFGSTIENKTLKNSFFFLVNLSLTAYLKVS